MQALMEDDNKSDASEVSAPKEKYVAKKMNPVRYADPAASKRQKREEDHLKRKLSKTAYKEELRREQRDAPEEIFGGTGTKAKQEYSKEMRNLERVEEMTFSRMPMNKEQRKAQRQMMRRAAQDDGADLNGLDDLQQLDRILDNREGEKRAAKSETEIVGRKRDKKAKGKHAKGFN